MAAVEGEGPGRLGTWNGVGRGVTVAGGVGVAMLDSVLEGGVVEVALGARGEVCADTDAERHNSHVNIVSRVRPGTDPFAPRIISPDDAEYTWRYLNGRLK